MRRFLSAIILLAATAPAVQAATQALWFVAAGSVTRDPESTARLLPSAI